jgi:hypothetical protein
VGLGSVGLSMLLVSRVLLVCVGPLHVVFVT